MFSPAFVAVHRLFPLYSVFSRRPVLIAQDLTCLKSRGFMEPGSKRELIFLTRAESETGLFRALNGSKREDTGGIYGKDH